MFGNDSLPSIVMRYGCKAPHTGADVMAEQAQLAHRYRNRLVEIELLRRQQVESAVREYDPVLPGLETRIEQLVEALSAARTAIRQQNSHQRQRRADPGDRQQIMAMRSQLKQLRTERKERRKSLFAQPSLRRHLERIDADSLTEQKRARAASGLYWGTYLVVETALNNIRKGAPPRYKRRDGSAHLAVQLQGGLTMDQVFSGSDQRIRIEPAPNGTGWTTAHVRVASAGRNPVWASLRVRLHRPLPADSILKWAHLICTPIGPRREWSLQLVVSRASGWRKEDLAEDHTAGVDLGWRVLPRGAGLRIAYMVGSDGHEEQLTLPMEQLERWRKAEDLRSIRDRHFNTCRDELANWLTEHRDMLPEGLRERTASIRQWRSQARLAALCLAWREQRFAGDEWVFNELAWGDLAKHPPGLEQWRRHDKHLWSWEASQRAKAVAWRRDVFRNWVAQLSRRYQTVHIEDCNWADLARHAPAEESVDDSSMRLYRHIASPGALAQMITERCAKVVRVDPAYTTQACHVCGMIEKFDAANELRHQCTTCGAVWDQDRSAAVNLLAGGVVVAEAAEPLDG